MGKNPPDEHLCGSAEIERAFRVKAETVAQWRKKGAPIYRLGKKLQANYYELWRWIVINMLAE